ncbi:hypothetical protein RND71_023240 [Anisodus tanguticus]|uniref:Bifunctional inhibitor/plant lipid transfer protein/seed storage helical domain-containing protein n=1 Tax=Anisodus tanguticus TaxID=243964 RepID=A0AAE1RU14_9SOLA|nr:hypothetical protein RND71_023240 [Anisodus tanguticus]
MDFLWSSLGEKCGAEFQKVVACLVYATGKAPSPTKECCDAATDIKELHSRTDP